MEYPIKDLSTQYIFLISSIAHADSFTPETEQPLWNNKIIVPRIPKRLLNRDFIVPTKVSSSAH